ncbi:MAG: hypothetical protein HONBIEJF_02093 [Fimbriimonadaceae bacterium]|nr:hypothetical protein [Fimbriimonadaceae bacterium]
MVACPKCELQNSVDSRFCRGCGDELPADALEVALHDHEQLVLEGHRLLTEHRYEEATMIAEKAIEENPQSVVALTLRGDCYERRGKIVEALECYERVVELKPDSTLDRIKLTQLRNMLTTAPLRADDNKKRSAAFAGVGIALGAVAFGLWGVEQLTKSDLEKTNPTLLAANDRTDPLTTNAYYSAPNLTGEANRLRPGDEPAIGETKADPNAGNTKTATEGRRELPSLNPGRTRDSILPPTGAGLSGTIDEGSNPITPNLGTMKVTPDQPVERTNVESDPPPVADNQAKSNEEKPGVIEITPSKGSGSSSSGSNQDDAAMFRKIARDQFMAGRYQQSAETYMKALKAGAPAGMVYQRLGQCYDKLGKTGDAIGAYRKAIAALSSAGAAGANQAAIDACQNAIRALGG